MYNTYIKFSKRVDIDRQDPDSREVATTNKMVLAALSVGFLQAFDLKTRREVV
jgi:hypothetical protein